MKEKIQMEHKIPIEVQRWIVSKQLAYSDELTIQDMNLEDGSDLFLYIVNKKGIGKYII